MLDSTPPVSLIAPPALTTTDSQAITGNENREKPPSATTPVPATKYKVAPIPPFQGGRNKTGEATSKIQPRKASNLIGQYLLLQTLGEGEFAKVKLGMHIETGEEAAIKLMKRETLDSPSRLAKVQREIAVLKACSHPNIVKLYNVIENERYIAIVLEYASGGELFDHILAHRYLKERDACRLFAQLISGVSYMHAKNIVHRDLKLENLLLDRNRNLIITDFGFANQFGANRGEDLMATSCGSPCYAAPELVVSEKKYVGTAADIWSCGVILYAMLAGYLPYDDDPNNPDGENINQLYKYILSTTLKFPPYISEDACDLLRLMLVAEPERRCDMETIKKHRWLAPCAHIFKPRPIQPPPPVVREDAVVPFHTPNLATPSSPALLSPTFPTPASIDAVVESSSNADKRHTIQLEYDDVRLDGLSGTNDRPVSQPPPSTTNRSSSTMVDSDSTTATPPLPIIIDHSLEVVAEETSPTDGSNLMPISAYNSNTGPKRHGDERRNTLAALTATTKGLLASIRPTPNSPKLFATSSASGSKSEKNRRKAISVVMGMSDSKELSMVQEEGTSATANAEKGSEHNPAKKVMEWFRRKSLGKYAGDVIKRLSTDRYGGGAGGESLEWKLRTHSGAVDQGALTSLNPIEVMVEVRKAILDMGCVILKSSEFKLKCVRPPQEGAAQQPTTAASSSATWKRPFRKFNTLPVTTTANPSARFLEQKQPVYGESTIDSGEEIRFAVEVCRIRNLRGLYIVNVKRLKGSVWSYKFVYHNFLERLDLKSKGYMDVPSMGGSSTVMGGGNSSDI